MSELIDKIHNSLTSVEFSNEQAKETLATLIANDEFVFFHSGFLTLPVIDIIAASFIMNYATICCEGEELATYQPIHVARFTADNSLDKALYTFLIYHNGAVILVDRPEEDPLMMLSMHKTVCEAMGIEWEQVLIPAASEDDNGD